MAGRPKIFTGSVTGKALQSALFKLKMAHASEALPPISGEAARR
jgi:hypothetical protein